MSELGRDLDGVAVGRSHDPGLGGRHPRPGRVPAHAWHPWRLDEDVFELDLDCDLWSSCPRAGADHVAARQDEVALPDDLADDVEEVVVAGDLVRLWRDIRQKAPHNRSRKISLVLHRCCCCRCCCCHVIDVIGTAGVWRAGCRVLEISTSALSSWRVSTALTAFALVLICGTMESASDFQMHARNCLLRLWGSEIEARSVASGRIPVPLPVGLGRSNLQALGDPRKVWVSPKADGERCFLLFGVKTSGLRMLKHADGSPQTFAALVDRRGVATDVSKRFSRAPQRLFAGTLDCEKMEDGSLLAFDAVAMCGYSVRNKTYGEARVRMKREVDGLVGVSVKDACLCSRGKFLARSILERSCGDSRYDGVVLTRDDRVLAPGPNPRILKFKECHTVDLGVDLEGNLYCGDRDAAEPGKPPRWRTVSGPRFLFAARHVQHEGPFSIIEFEIGSLRPDGRRELVPLKRREDKTFPNTRQTFDATVQAVVDNLKGSDVADFLRL